ncbi:YciI family protein [Allokutzneria sp. NRRL B-24872]|uniref:YciI family protein n=1 Tax=Allokutzneria sp. NRRL B-24872 TaxID=1137961 RepID=UPI000A367F3E|nr:YciI family protein [Allokutzneria sp. NRRL B-24872]
MKQYMLSIYQPDGPAPAPEVLDPIMRELDALNADMRAKGAWVFAGGMHEPSTATVLRVKGEEVLVTDGPFTEGREHLGGFTIIQAADLDEALEWGRRLAKVITLPIEVRPMQDGSSC